MYDKNIHPTFSCTKFLCKSLVNSPRTGTKRLHLLSKSWAYSIPLVKFEVGFWAFFLLIGIDYDPNVATDTNYDVVSSFS